MSKKEKDQEYKERSTREPSRSLTPFEEMDNWFEDFLRRTPAWLPRLQFPTTREVMFSIDVFEDEIDVIVKAELPGLAKEDLDVNIAGNVITISGEKKAEEKVEKKNYHRLERSYGSFTRTVRLPAETRSEEARASFKDGVLEVRIPKTEEARKKGKKIEID
jgi:HSP20 family protein